MPLKAENGLDHPQQNSVSPTERDFLLAIIAYQVLYGKFIRLYFTLCKAIIVVHENP